MTQKEILKKICAEKNTTLGSLEKQLGFSNGSLGSAASLSAPRALQLAEYLNVPVEYLITGDEKYRNKPMEFQASTAVEYYQQREALLKTISDEQQELLDLSMRIDDVKSSLELHKARYRDLCAEDFMYE